MSLPDVPGGEVVMQQTVPYPTWWAGATTIGIKQTNGNIDSFPVTQVFLYIYGVEFPSGAESANTIIPWTEVVAVYQTS